MHRLTQYPLARATRSYASIASRSDLKRPKHLRFSPRVLILASNVPFAFVRTPLMPVLDNEPRGFAGKPSSTVAGIEWRSPVAGLGKRAASARETPAREPPAANGSPTGSFAPGAAIAGAGSAGRAP